MFLSPVISYALCWNSNIITKVKNSEGMVLMLYVLSGGKLQVNLDTITNTMIPEI